MKVPWVRKAVGGFIFNGVPAWLSGDFTEAFGPPAVSARCDFLGAASTLPFVFVLT